MSDSPSVSTILKVLALALVSFLAILLLNGCAMQTTSPSSVVNTPIGSISGLAHGGRQAIVSANIYLYAASTSGYGGASTSLLNSSAGHTDIDGLHYVMTDANGNFTLTGDYTCVAGTQIYMLSLGGQPTTGTTNSAAGLMAVLGECPASGSMASVTPTVIMNEVSTVTAAYALSGFAVDATHIGAPSATSALAGQGLKNAFASSALLYDISGLHGINALTLTPGGGSAPHDKVQALANSLAACVNSTGPSSTQCATNLFSAVKSAGTSGSTATDTASEAIYIAHNPATAVEKVFDNQAPGGAAPFLTGLARVPNDFTLAISYSGGSLSSASGIAIDGSGNAWVSNSGNDSITQITPLGVATNYTGGGLNAPSAIAIDTDGNPWVANRGSGTVTKFVNGTSTVSGSYWSSGHTPTSTPTPTSIAIDGSGNVWVGSGDNTAYKLTSAGAFSAESYGTNALLSTPSGIAIDNYVSASAGNDVFFSNSVAASSVGATKVLVVPQASNNSWVNGGVSTANAIAADSTNHVWTANADDTLGAVSSLGQALTGAPCSGGGLSGAHAIAIDGNGNVFLANKTGNTVSEFTKACVAVSPAGNAFGFVSATPASPLLVNSPTGLAIDGSGNVWVTNGGTNTVLEFVGMATPVVTPLAKGVSSGFTPASKP